MSISKRVNSDANPTNALKLTDGLNLCGDESVQRMKYAVTFDTTALTSITKISVGGAEVTLSSAQDPTHADVAKDLRDKIITVIEGLTPPYLYDPTNDNGMSIVYDSGADELTIEIYNSTLVFDYVESGTYPFVAS